MAGIAGSAGKVANETFEELVEKLASGKPMLSGNGAISKIGNNMFGGGEFAARVFKNDDKITEALTKTFKEGGVKTGKTNWGKVAGSYIGASAGYRVLSGGGISRDKHGNPNLIGVPFV